MSTFHFPPIDVDATICEFNGVPLKMKHFIYGLGGFQIPLKSKEEKVEKVGTSIHTFVLHGEDCYETQTMSVNDGVELLLQFYLEKIYSIFEQQNMSKYDGFGCFVMQILAQEIPGWNDLTNKMKWFDEMERLNKEGRFD